MKNPEAKEQGRIYFAAVDDYLSRAEKLTQLTMLGSISKAPLTSIVPDDHGDWLNQRRDDFAKFISLNGKDKDALGIFANYSNGIKSNRDAWSFNSSSQALEQNLRRCITCYNEQLAQYQQAQQKGQSFTLVRDSTAIRTGTLENSFKRELNSPAFDAHDVVAALYRPFCKQKLYNQKFWIERTYQIPQLFPCVEAENMVIGISCGNEAKFGCMMTNCITNLHAIGDTQCFPRYLYRPVAVAESGAQIGVGGENSQQPHS